MKRKIAAIIAAIMIAFTSAGVLTACSRDKADIVVTIFPEYDWVMNVLGENKSDLSVKLLADGTDLHSYAPSFEDRRAISYCNVFIYVGGESDEWVEDALKTKPNPERIAINLLEVLGDKAHEEEGGLQEDEDHEEETEYDEHVWLSLKNAKLFVKVIAEAISEFDKENADIYSTNANSYIEKLDILDGKYATAVSEGTKDTLLFAQRFPFLYLVKDYGLNYYAAFKGCSTEDNPSFTTQMQLAEIIDGLDLKVILILESAKEDSAKTIRNLTKTKDQAILRMDSLQSSTRKEYQNGRTYLNVMEQNLETLKQALA